MLVNRLNRRGRVLLLNHAGNVDFGSSLCDEFDVRFGGSQCLEHQSGHPHMRLHAFAHKAEDGPVVF